MVKHSEDMFSSVHRIPACDRRTDGVRQTDGQTSCDNIIRAMHTHSKNCFIPDVAQIKMYRKKKQIKSTETGNAESTETAAFKKWRYCDKIKPYTKHNTNRNRNINL